MWINLLWFNVHRSTQGKPAIELIERGWPSLNMDFSDHWGVVHITNYHTCWHVGCRNFHVRPHTNEFKRIEDFLDNFKGAFFYATPQGGSQEMTKFASGLRHPSEIFHLLKTLNEDAARISNEFRLHRDYNWNARTFALAESLPTTSLVSPASISNLISAPDYNSGSCVG